MTLFGYWRLVVGFCWLWVWACNNWMKQLQLMQHRQSSFAATCQMKGGMLPCHCFTISAISRKRVERSPKRSFSRADLPWVMIDLRHNTPCFASNRGQSGACGLRGVWDFILIPIYQINSKGSVHVFLSILLWRIMDAISQMSNILEYHAFGIY